MHYLHTCVPKTTTHLNRVVILVVNDHNLSNGHLQLPSHDLHERTLPPIRVVTTASSVGLYICCTPRKPALIPPPCKKNDT
jgi:hypothetical protein